MQIQVQKGQTRIHIFTRMKLNELQHICKYPVAKIWLAIVKHGFSEYIFYIYAHTHRHTNSRR